MPPAALPAVARRPPTEPLSPRITKGRRQHPALRHAATLQRAQTERVLPTTAQRDARAVVVVPALRRDHSEPALPSDLYATADAWRGHWGGVHP